MPPLAVGRSQLQTASAIFDNAVDLGSPKDYIHYTGYVHNSRSCVATLTQCVYG